MSDILAGIDWQRVEHAVLHGPDGEPLSYEFAETKEMIWAASEKWLANDLATLENVSTESLFHQTELCRYLTRGYIDISGRFAHGEKAGRVLVVDWKTSESDLDLTWQKRLVGSLQWKLYAYVMGASYISYRGVNRKCKCREVQIEVPAWGIAGIVERQFRMIGDQIHNLVDEAVWPMKMPSACGAYNSTCQFLSDCESDTMPRFNLDERNITLSYSGIERFLLCPEKFRRLAQATVSDEGTDATRLGSAFHRGMEEVYKQAFNLICTPTA